MSVITGNKSEWIGAGSMLGCGFGVILSIHCFVLLISRSTAAGERGNKKGPLQGQVAKLKSLTHNPRNGHNRDVGVSSTLTKEHLPPALPSRHKWYQSLC